MFWGANTFNQHHKTRHNCKTCPHADKVIKYTRKKRAWACGFCAAFLPSMDRYIDHIGLHYESGRTRAHWYHSNVIYGLLHQPGVNAAWKNIIGSRFSHIPKEEQPRYGWDAKTTGRKQGFLENETPGNLQDLLEFFNPTKDDPVKVARLAFDFAELTPASQAAGRGSLDVPDKVPQPPPPPPELKREKTTTSKRKPSGGHKQLASPPAEKERPITQWPGFMPDAVPEIPGQETIRDGDRDVRMGDYDATAVPQPLFASTISPPPQAQYNHHPPPPSIAISPSSDQPTFLTPTTPLSQPPPTPFPSGLPRDTVVELLSEYMSSEQMHAVDTQGHPAMDMHGMPHDSLCAQPPPAYAQYEDWNSLCTTMVEEVGSPRHNGPPLPPAPHEQPRQQMRRSDFWTPHPGSVGGPESMYIDNAQACDLGSMGPPPQRMQDVGMGHSSDVWASTGAVDYEGMGYEDEIAPPPPSANWL